MADQILPEGIRFFPKNDKTPDFVLGTMIITPNKLYEWLKANPTLLTEYNGDKQVKLQLLKSKEGKLYAKVDTYKKPEPSNDEQYQAHRDSQYASPNTPGGSSDPVDDLPF